MILYKLLILSMLSAYELCCILLICVFLNNILIKLQWGEYIRREDKVKVCVLVFCIVVIALCLTFI